MWDPHDNSCKLTIPRYKALVQQNAAISERDNAVLECNNAIAVVDPHMGLVFFICYRSHFLPRGGLLKSQMLLPGWVVSESGSGLEMQWGGDTCWRIFRRAFRLLEWSWIILWKCEGDPPSLTMNPGQMG